MKLKSEPKLIQLKDLKTQYQKEFNNHYSKITRNLLSRPDKIKESSSQMVKNSQEKNKKVKTIKMVSETVEEVVKKPKLSQDKQTEKNKIISEAPFKQQKITQKEEVKGKKKEDQANTPTQTANKNTDSTQKTIFAGKLSKSASREQQEQTKEDIKAKKREKQIAACAKAESKQKTEEKKAEESEGSVEEHFFAGNNGEGENRQAFANLEDQDKKSEGVYLKDELLRRVDQIQSAFRRRLKLEKKQKIPWNEHLSLVSDEKIVITENTEISSDIQREVQFYKTTLANAQLALKYLQEEGVATKRPDDYFAEMFKSDKIMGKIRTKLVLEQEAIKSFEEKKQRQESRKLQRILRAKSDQKKSKEKRDNLKAIDKWKEEIKVKGDKAKDLSEFMLKPSSSGKKPHPIQKSITKGEKTSDRPGLRPSTSNKFGTDLRGKGERSFKSGGDGRKFGGRSNSRDGKPSFGDRSLSRGGSFSGKGSKFNEKGGKNFGNNRGPKPINKSFGGKGGDRSGKSFGGDRGGKSFGGGKSFSGDRAGKPFGGKGGKSFGGGVSRGGKSFGGSTRGGKSFGSNRGGKGGTRGGRGGRGGRK